jgi:hypothetical protein
MRHLLGHGLTDLAASRLTYWSASSGLRRQSGRMRICAYSITWSASGRLKKRPGLREWLKEPPSLGVSGCAGAWHWPRPCPTCEEAWTIRNSATGRNLGCRMHHACTPWGHKHRALATESRRCDIYAEEHSPNNWQGPVRSCIRVHQCRHFDQRSCQPDSFYLTTRRMVVCGRHRNAVQNFTVFEYTNPGCEVDPRGQACSGRRNARP